MSGEARGDDSAWRQPTVTGLEGKPSYPETAGSILAAALREADASPAEAEGPDFSGDI